MASIASFKSFKTYAATWGYSLFDWSLQLERWMSYLSSLRSLADIKIPGTHDSGAQLDGLIASIAKTQTLTITEQCRIGIRYFDIRCRHLYDEFAIHHGRVFENLMFDEVLQELYAFLEANPTEIILVRIKSEYTPKGNTQSFEETFLRYIAEDRHRWYLGDTVPRLGYVRGRIVLLRDFQRSIPPLEDENEIDQPEPLGIDWEQCNIQDVFQVRSARAKMRAFQEFLNLLTEECSSNRFNINHASGYILRVVAPDVKAVSNIVNPWLIDAEPFREVNCGIVIPMDFVTQDLVRVVVAANFYFAR